MMLPPTIDSVKARGTDAKPIRLHPSMDRFLIVAFLVLLALPPLGTMFGIQRATEDEQNRKLAAFPPLDLTRASWRAFADDFTKYFEDNFAFRPLLVRWQATARMKALHVSPSRSVIRGTDGWWFYADDGAMQDYAEAPPFTTAELEEWRRTLQDTTDWMHARGIAYLFVMVPDKHQVYSEYMPASIRRVSPSRMDQLAAYLAQHSTVPMLDLRAVLERGKSQERIYHLTDTHWNDRGAYIGYSAIISALSDSVPGFRPQPRDMFHARQVRRGGLDLARMMWLTSVLDEDDLMLVPRRSRSARIVEPPRPEPHGIEARLVTMRPDTAQPRAIIFRDSFGSALIPLLSEHFSRAVYLWQNHADPGVILQERPHVVIQEMVGRRLSTLSPYNPFERPAQ